MSRGTPSPRRIPRRLPRAWRGVRRDARVERLALAHGGGQGPHGLLQRGAGVEAMRIEDVDVVEPHPAQALVEAGEQVLARAPLAVGAGPHVVAGLGGDHELVAVGGEVAAEDVAHVRLGRSVGRSVVVGQVEVRHAQVEGPAQDPAAVLARPVVAEVLPQPEGDGGEARAAAPATPVPHGRVPVTRRFVDHHDHLRSRRRPGRHRAAVAPRWTATRRRRPLCRERPGVVAGVLPVRRRPTGARRPAPPPPVCDDAGEMERGPTAAHRGAPSRGARRRP